MKSRCQVCDPSCTLEVRGYSATLPVTCPFDTGYTPKWNPVKKVAKKTKSTKKAPVQKVEHTVAGFRLL